MAARKSLIKEVFMKRIALVIFSDFFYGHVICYPVVNIILLNPTKKQFKKPCHGIAFSCFGVMRMVNSHTYLNINQRLVKLDYTNRHLSNSITFPGKSLPGSS